MADPAQAVPPAAGPLAGLRVIDAASLYAAPLLASMLADQGADVVKLEPPGGDPYRSTVFWPLTARGKRSVVLDLATDAGRQSLHGLVRAADVVVVNEPAARLARRGLDPDTLLTVNPSLVIAHVSGYGADGPLATRTGNGTLGEAFAGLTHMTGTADGPPVLPSVPLGDAVMAFAGAFGVLVAWHAVRTSGGPGRVVDVNPVDAMLHVVGPTLVEATAGAAAGATPPDGSATDWPGPRCGTSSPRRTAAGSRSASPPPASCAISPPWSERPTAPTGPCWPRRSAAGWPGWPARTPSTASPRPGCRSPRSTPHTTWPPTPIFGTATPCGRCSPRRVIR